MTNDQVPNDDRSIDVIRHSSFVLLSSFVLRHSSFPQLVENVLRDALDDRIAAAQAVRPIGGAAREDGAGFFVHAHHCIADAILFEALVPNAVVGMPLRGARAEDDERLWRAIAMRGE